MHPQNPAAIDLGTNSCRLSIADGQGRFIYRDAVAVRLGEGLYAGQCFLPQAVERTLKTLTDFAVQMQKYHVDAYRAIATAACRTATDAPEFLEHVRTKTGIELEVIDAYEEARLTLAGAACHADPQKEFIVVYDLGGGSTEITLATTRPDVRILHTISVPWGARTAAEAFNLIEYSPLAAMRLQNEISAFVDRFKKEADLKLYENRFSLIATSSTPLRLAAMLHNRGRYERGFDDGTVLPLDGLTSLIDKTVRMPLAERAASPYIGETRAPVFTAACLIFKTIYESFHTDTLTASFKGAQDGIIAELLKK
jgi:exopolyphosphatase/guanosine-5'-triphosphate,3'-diphosphate pyrophosphatase